MQDNGSVLGFFFVPAVGVRIKPLPTRDALFKMLL